MVSKISNELKQRLKKLKKFQEVTNKINALKKKFNIPKRARENQLVKAIFAKYGSDFPTKSIKGDRGIYFKPLQVEILNLIKAKSYWRGYIKRMIEEENENNID